MLLAGCSADSDEPEQAVETMSSAPAPNIVQPGAPGEDSEELTPEELDELEPPGHTAADVAFMQAMLHHHAQALQMAAYVPDRAAGRDVRLLARRLEISQEDEMAQMRRWLEARDEAVAGAHGEADLMPGMLTAAELAQLKSASGRRFNRLFLEGMLRHHRGALTMVAQLRTEPGAGVEPEIDAFARHVEADQEIEISRIEALLTALEPQASG
jgi:uncharacterized protein (DUF305 family)